MSNALRMTANLTGGDELARALQAMSLKMERKTVREGLKAGADPILHAARSKAPVKTGLLASEIRVRTGKKRDTLYASVTVGKLGFYKGRAFYGAFIEYGHFAGKRRGYLFRDATGRYSHSSHGAIGYIERTFVPARPFMRPAYDEQKENALAAFMQKVREGVEEHSA